MLIYEITCEPPLLPLIDSIIKQVGGSYIYEFGRKIPLIFKLTFDTANDKDRLKLFELRKSWTQIFSPGVLMRLDRKVHDIDNDWPLYVCLPCELWFKSNFTKCVLFYSNFFLNWSPTTCQMTPHMQQSTHRINQKLHNSVCQRQQPFL